MKLSRENNIHHSVSFTTACSLKYLVYFQEDIAEIHIYF